jgi:trimeric autotransporter adhesin
MDLLPNPNEDVKSAAQFANELRQKLEARERELEAATARIQGLEKLTAALGARRTLQPGAPPLSLDINNNNPISIGGLLPSPSTSTIFNSATGIASTPYNSNPFLGQGWPTSLSMVPSNGYGYGIGGGGGGGSFSVTPLQLSDSNIAAGFTPAITPASSLGRSPPTKAHASSFSGMFTMPSSTLNAPPPTISEHAQLSGAAKYAIVDSSSKMTPRPGTAGASISRGAASSTSAAAPSRSSSSFSSNNHASSLQQPVDLLGMIAHNKETRMNEVQQGEAEAQKRLFIERSANEAIERERANRRLGGTHRKHGTTVSMPSTPYTSNPRLSSSSSSSSSSSNSFSFEMVSFPAASSEGEQHQHHQSQSSLPSITQDAASSSSSSSQSQTQAAPPKRTPLVVHPEGGGMMRGVSGIGHFAPKASFSSSANSNTFARLSAAMLSQAYVPLPTHPPQQQQQQQHSPDDKYKHNNINQNTHNMHAAALHGEQHTSTSGPPSSSSTTTSISSQNIQHANTNINSSTTGSSSSSSSGSGGNNGFVIKHGFSGPHISPTIAPHLTFGAKNPYLRYSPSTIAATTTNNTSTRAGGGGGGGGNSPTSKSGGRGGSQVSVSRRSSTATSSAQSSPSDDGSNTHQISHHFTDASASGESSTNQSIGPAAMRRLEANKKAAEFVDKYRNRSSSASSATLNEGTSSTVLENDNLPDGPFLSPALAHVEEKSSSSSFPSSSSSSSSFSSPSNPIAVSFASTATIHPSTTIHLSNPSTSHRHESTNDSTRAPSTSTSPSGKGVGGGNVLPNNINRSQGRSSSSGGEREVEAVEPIKVFDAEAAAFAAMMNFNLLGPQLQASSLRR